MPGVGIRGVGVTGQTLLARAMSVLRSPKCVLWQDASDLSTLFQDSAGTTPVTAVEQPVGLVLDKKTAGQFGANAVSGAWVNTYTTPFDTFTPSGGSGFTATTSTAKGDIRVAVNCSLALGKTYAIDLTAAMTGATLIGVFFSTGGNSGNAGAIQSPASVTGNATYKATGTTTGAATQLLLIFSTSGASTVSVSGFTVREIPGVHFIQATPASRPTLSSRYNLLTKTEQFDDVIWTKTEGTITANAAVAPDGTTTADRWVPSTNASNHFIAMPGVVWVADTEFSVCAKADGYNFLVLLTPVANVSFNLSTGVVAASGALSASMTALGNGWYRCTMRTSHNGTGVAYISGSPVSSAAFWSGAGDGVSGVLIWGASIVRASDASLPYQRVNTATDYDFDFSKFPPYLRFDGVDDSRASAATVDLTGTDKITVVGAWHKASDAAAAMLLESSADASANNGAINLMGPVSAAASQFRWLSRGTTLQTALDSSSAAPMTRVVSGLGDIAGDRATLRINGAQVAQSTGDQGTGNYGNLTLNVGSRNGASLRFNGREYGFAVFNTTLTASELAAVEAYFRAKSRAY